MDTPDETLFEAYELLLDKTINWVNDNNKKQTPVAFYTRIPPKGTRSPYIRLANIITTVEQQRRTCTIWSSLVFLEIVHEFHPGHHANPKGINQVARDVIKLATATPLTLDLSPDFIATLGDIEDHQTDSEQLSNGYIFRKLIQIRNTIE